MTDQIARHYSENRGLAGSIKQSLQNAGKDIDRLTTADLAIVDEFHIRGLGEDFPAMARNQVRNVTERRIRTVSYICAA